MSNSFSRFNNSGSDAVELIELKYSSGLNDVGRSVATSMLADQLNPAVRMMETHQYPSDLLVKGSGSPQMTTRQMKVMMRVHNSPVAVLSLVVSVPFRSDSQSNSLERPTTVSSLRLPSSSLSEVYQAGFRCPNPINPVEFDEVVPGQEPNSSREPLMFFDPQRLTIPVDYLFED